ncbi:YybH family protein [Salinispira pacifica]
MTTIEHVTSEVHDVYRRYAAALVSGDSCIWAALWDERCVYIPPNEPAVHGRSTIERWFHSHQAETDRQFTVNVEEVRSAGDLAFARGTMLSSAGISGASTLKLASYGFLSIFRKQADGGWRILRECVNQDRTFEG